jgi:hypothetical protein
MRHLYGRIPGQPLVAIAIEEPGGLLSSDSATLATGGHPRAAPEWMPPQRPTIIVAQSIRGDPLGQMYARHQIEPVRYFAGRGYQELHEFARTGHMGTFDPTRTRCDSGRFPDIITDRQRLAARRLRTIDRAVIEYLGTVGLFIARCVLIERRSLREAGERLAADKTTRAYLFKSSLSAMAVKLGLATASLLDDDKPPEKPQKRNGKT